MIGWPLFQRTPSGDSHRFIMLAPMSLSCENPQAHGLITSVTAGGESFPMPGFFMGYVVGSTVAGGES